jgi:hypothetical protein
MKEKMKWREMEIISDACKRRISYKSYKLLNSLVSIQRAHASGDFPSDSVYFDVHVVR